MSSFAIVSLSEFGDKTQIAVISLSAKHRPRSVFIGALLALALVDGVSASVGGLIAPFVSAFWVGLVAGISFIAFGTYTLLSKESAIIRIKERSRTVTTSILLISTLELGDKTQLAIVALAAEYNAPIQVFLGAMLSFALMTALGVIFGRIISRYVSARYIRIGASLIFFAFGVLFLIEAIGGIRPF
ncbi:MAG TPA: TMEM165/GDT1 family protein [Candidatus Bathyarchaeia archaeon]|nr:TMEM165/GDT1 family protein [Candidatus Bathyarchaeia archaeon]